MGVELGVAVSMNVQASTPIRPHYLLELASIALRDEDGELLASPPDWVQESLHATPFVVVRRGTSANGTIPVGVRGSSRERRFAAFISGDTTRRVVTPSDLMDEFQRVPPTGTTVNGAFESLAILAEQWRGMNLIWGPGGSAGFELATGAFGFSNYGDLDIVIYADEKVAIDELSALHLDLPAFDTKIDIQIETPHCGFSLAEYLRDYPREILLKTPYGPVLGTDPWR